jgi:capsular polysaccharide biosynthesis protein
MAVCSRFAPAGRSALVEYFQLEDVIFDGKTGALFKNGVHVAESRYGTSASHRFYVDPPRVITQREECPIFIGFHSWHHNYYHWLTQCIPSIYWAREIHAGREFVLALPKLNSWQEMALSLAGLSGIERYTVDPRWQYEVRRLTYATFTQGVTTCRPSQKRSRFSVRCVPR